MTRERQHAAKKTTPETALAKPYKPSPRELEVHEAQRARRKALPPAPGLNTETKPDGEILLSVGHPDPAFGWGLLMETMATGDGVFMLGITSQLLSAVPKGKNPATDTINFMLAIVRGIEPKDQVETMLAAQMAAVHNATMIFARRLNHVENIAQQDSAVNAFNKLTRTFAVQLEALKRYRTGGEQRVLVQHVNVNEGGQAIVGNVTREGRGPRQNPETSP